MKSVIKAAMYKVFPQLATQIFSARARAYSHKLVRELGCAALNEKLLKRFGNRVLHGPFAGMTLSPETCREHLAPFLLGTYESELHQIWCSILQMKFSLLIDVGAKFGYYAVGLAKQFPDREVLAFDTDPWARKATREMGAANGVSVEVRAFCNPDWLRNHLPEGAFIFSDCEGYEATLFGSSEAPNLQSATMLIEIHEELSPGVTELLCKKFARSHEAMIIPARANQPDTMPELASLTEAEREMAMNEYRPGNQCWLFLSRKV